MSENKNLISKIMKIGDLVTCVHETIENKEHKNTEGTDFPELTLLNLTIDEINEAIDLVRDMEDRALISSMG